MTNAQSAMAFDERLPTELESTNAEALRQIVASQIQDNEDTVIHVSNDEGKPQPITLTPALAQSFLDVLRLVSSGRGFSLTPLDQLLTTQQAADILNVSRPHFIKILERESLEYELVGRHRRIKAAVLFDYKERRDNERAEHLDNLAATDGGLDLI